MASDMFKQVFWILAMQRSAECWSLGCEPGRPQEVELEAAMADLKADKPLFFCAFFRLRTRNPVCEICVFSEVEGLEWGC